MGAHARRLLRRRPLRGRLAAPARRRTPTRLRDYASRADAIHEDGLDEQERLTRGDRRVGRHRLAPTSSRPRIGGLAADPIIGLQASLPLCMRLARGARRGRRRARWPPSSTASAPTSARSPTASARASPRGLGARRVRRAGRRSQQLDAWLADADPPRTRCWPCRTRRRRGRRRAAGTGALLAGRRAAGAARPPRPTATCSARGRAARPGSEERCGLTLAARTATRPTHADPALLHDHRATPPRRSTRSACARCAKLADEYRALGPEVVGTDDLAGDLRGDARPTPKLHYEHGEEIVAAVPDRAGQRRGGDGRLVRPAARRRRLRGRGHAGRGERLLLPAAPPTARAAARSSSTPPTPRRWGRFELEAMAFHEGVPGHHLQLAIAAELPDVDARVPQAPPQRGVRRGLGALHRAARRRDGALLRRRSTGWGCISADSMRACRLVVDTGLHALGWSRQQAVDYMVANSPLTEGVVPARGRPLRLHARPGARPT